MNQFDNLSRVCNEIKNGECGFPAAMRQPQNVAVVIYSGAFSEIYDGRSCPLHHFG
jgi:hypothetical protein